jgi:hypothetical protein
MASYPVRIEDSLAVRATVWEIERHPLLTCCYAESSGSRN